MAKKKDTAIPRQFMSDILWKEISYTFFECDVNDLATKLNSLLKKAAAENFIKIRFEFE